MGFHNGIGDAEVPVRSRLGLGPDYSSAINAKDASFSAPPPESTIPTAQVDAFAQAAKVSR